MTPPDSNLDNGVMTTGEVYRIAKDIKSDVKEIRDRLDEYPTMRDVANVENRVRDMENNLKWVLRIGIPALVGVVFNLLTNVERIAS